MMPCSYTFVAPPAVFQHFVPPSPLNSLLPAYRTHCPQADETYNETCDIEYFNISKVVTAQQRVKGQVVITADVQCKVFPPSLGGPSADQAAAEAEAAGRAPWFKLGVRMQLGEGNRLVQLLQELVSARILHCASKLHVSGGCKHTGCPAARILHSLLRAACQATS